MVRNFRVVTSCDPHRLTRYGANVLTHDHANYLTIQNYRMRTFCGRSSLIPSMPCIHPDGYLKPTKCDPVWSPPRLTPWQYRSSTMEVIQTAPTWKLKRARDISRCPKPGLTFLRVFLPWAEVSTKLLIQFSTIVLIEIRL